ncbi:hypothetical protein AMECASPLE_027531 [Ameca splendens]|uniref:Transmembrane protein n=1 Tax=Ameca splendens TaxID=208324 RepID=A0ABV0XUE9_9TELE
MWCVCVDAGGVVGAAGSSCVPLGLRDLLPGEFVPSWCGVGGFFVSTVLGGVCSVTPVGGGWGGIVWGSYLAITVCCVVGGRIRREYLKWGRMWNLRCVGVSLLAFRGWSSSVEVCPCQEGIYGVWVRAHVFDICVLAGGGPVGRFMLEFLGGGGLMGLRSDFIGVLGLFYPVTALVSGLVWTR